MVNWYKISQEEPQDGLYPPSYIDIAHPSKNRPGDEEKWGDIILWYYQMGRGIKTYKMSNRIPTHDAIPGFKVSNNVIWGRYSEKQNIATLTFFKQNAFVVIDAAMELMETIGDVPLFVSGEIVGAPEIHEKFPSITFFVRKISPLEKSAQTAQELQQQYTALGDTHSVNITGVGQSETLQLPGGQMINAGDLLRQALNTIQHVLVQNGVREVNTDPLYDNPQAQGLAVSHEPGRIRVDVKRILEGIKTSLPPISQLDGVEMDPDVSQNVVEELSQYILAELGETMAHESQHVLDYQGALQQGNPFTSVQEAPAEQFGQRTRQQYFGI